MAVAFGFSFGDVVGMVKLSNAIMETYARLAARPLPDFEAIRHTIDNMAALTMELNQRLVASPPLIVESIRHTVDNMAALVEFLESSTREGFVKNAKEQGKHIFDCLWTDETLDRSSMRSHMLICIDAWDDEKDFELSEAPNSMFVDYGSSQPSSLWLFDNEYRYGPEIDPKGMRLGMSTVRKAIYVNSWVDNLSVSESNEAVGIWGIFSVYSNMKSWLRRSFLTTKHLKRTSRLAKLCLMAECFPRLIGSAAASNGHMFDIEYRARPWYLRAQNSWVMRDNPESGFWFACLLGVGVCELAMLYGLTPKARHKDIAILTSMIGGLFICALLVSNIREVIVLDWVGVNVAILLSATFYQPSKHTSGQDVPSGPVDTNTCTKF